MDEHILVDYSKVNPPHETFEEAIKVWHDERKCYDQKCEIRALLAAHLLGQSRRLMKPLCACGLAEEHFGPHL